MQKQKNFLTLSLPKVPNDVKVNSYHLSSHISNKGWKNCALRLKKVRVDPFFYMFHSDYFS